MPFRFLIVSLLILLGGVLSIAASVAVWQDRQIQNEDRFVQNVQDVFHDPQVQQVVADRLTEAVMTRTDVKAYITQGLDNLQARAGDNAPAGIPLLAAPLTRLASETVNRLCLQFLQSDAFTQVLDTAVRAMHKAVMAVVNNDTPLLNENNGQVVLNLRPVVQKVIEDLAGDRAQEVLKKINIPPDAGMIVVSEEADHPWLWKAVRWIKDINPVVPIITAIVFLLAIAIAKNRRRAVIATGATLAVIAGLALLALSAPVKELATSWPPRPEGQEAAKQVYDILLDSFRRQELFVFALGLGMVVVGSVAGDRRVVQAVRSAATGKEGVDAGGLIRERAGVLRLAGLAIAGLVLIVWPEPTLRTVLTVGLLLVLYMGVIWLFSSDQDWANRTRQRLADGMAGSADMPIQRRSGLVGWVAVHAGLLRLIGIVVGACFVLFVWDLSLRGFVLISAAELLYLAGLEWASTTARQPQSDDSD